MSRTFYNNIVIYNWQRKSPKQPFLFGLQWCAVVNIYEKLFNQRTVVNC